MSAYDFRPLIESDLDAFHDMINDPSLARMAGSIPSPVGRDWALARIMDNDEHGLFDASQRLLGSGSLFTRSDAPDAVEVGYAIHRDERGKGHATRLLALLLDQARGRGVSLLHAGVAKDNPASLHILTKAGFDVIGDHEYRSAGRPSLVQGWRLTLRL